MYPSDFSAADASVAPIDGPLLLGLPPLLATILLLLVLAIAGGMFMMGRWHAGRGQGSDAEGAPDDIHKAVLKASQAAMAASSDDLKTRAKALRTVIDDRLGPVLTVGQGVIGPLAALDLALKGEVAEKPRVPGKDHGHGNHGHGPSHSETKPAPTPVPTTVTQIFVGGSSSTVHPPGPATGGHDPDGHPHPDPHPGEPRAQADTHRAMTGPEQIDALSRAVRAFHDHWSRGPERIRELRAARAALSRRSAR